MKWKGKSNVRSEMKSRVHCEKKGGGLDLSRRDLRNQAVLQTSFPSTGKKRSALLIGSKDPNDFSVNDFRMSKVSTTALLQRRRSPNEGCEERSAPRRRETKLAAC